MKRQLDDYYHKFYSKEAKRFHALAENDFAKVKELAKWKEEVAENYPNDLQKHIEYLQQYHKTGDVISRFLLCAQEDGKVYDFYKTFVEIC